jgi:hypothetical protein
MGWQIIPFGRLDIHLRRQYFALGDEEHSIENTNLVHPKLGILTTGFEARSRSVLYRTRYPLPISPKKLERASQLYSLYRKAELDETAGVGEAVILAEPSLFKNRIEPPPGQASSIDSTIPSFDEDLGAWTDAKSVVPDSKIGRPRRRRRLLPKERAKAALIRYLGSCSECRQRAVSVS